MFEHMQEKCEWNFLFTFLEINSFRRRNKISEGKYFYNGKPN